MSQSRPDRSLKRTGTIAAIEGFSYFELFRLIHGGAGARGGRCSCQPLSSNVGYLTSAPLIAEAISVGPEKCAIILPSDLDALPTSNGKNVLDGADAKRR